MRIDSSLICHQPLCWMIVSFSEDETIERAATAVVASALLSLDAAVARR